MAAKSCRKIEVLVAADSILEFLQDQKEPVSIVEIARATCLTNDTVFRQIGTMSNMRWVEKIGDGYVLGLRIAMIWARVKARIEDRIEKDTTVLNILNGGNK